MLQLPPWVSTLTKSLWKRLLFFLVLTLLTVFINGYHFGTFDQVFHIPFLKSWMDPGLYPGDAFVGLREYYFSYFWYLLVPFYKIGLLEPAMFGIHILITWLTFWAFWELCERLFHNPLANLLLSFALVIPHIGFPGFQIIEFSLLNRTFTIPFLLFAILLYLNNQYIPAFFLVGFMFNIHLVYAGFVLAMFGVDIVLSLKQLAWKKLLPALAIFVVVVLPLFIRKSGVSGGFDFKLRPYMVYLESMSLGYNVYFPIGPQAYVWMGTLQGIACLILVHIAMKSRPANPDDQKFRHFVFASLLLITLGSIASYWLQVTFLVQLQLIRVGVFLLYFSYIYMAGFFANQVLQKNNAPIKAWLLYLSLVFTVIPIIPLLVYGVVKISNRKLLKIVVLPLLVLVIFAQIVLAAQGHYFAPGYHIYGSKSHWTDVQLWAKRNTPKDTRFITPPYEYWQYEADWRVFSERPTLATIPEIEVLHLNPDYTEGFVKRFSAIAPGVLDHLDGDYNHTLANTKKAFLSLTDSDFLQIAEDYGGDYLVLPNEKHSAFQQVYSNPSYTIYEIP
jgi:hypothetical protein